MKRLIDANALEASMYDAAFVKDTDMQRWDSGCWIRYKLFENVLDEQPTVDAVPVKHGKWTSSQAYAEVGECYCTVCKTVYYADDLLNVGETDECGVGQALLPNYCPHCGARMDKDERD